MTVFVAVLHSIVLPNGRLIMADLRDLAETLGYHNPRTLVATGNLVFKAEGTAETIEQRFETAFEKRFGKHIDFVVRTAAQWQRLVAVNPFGGDMDHVMVRIQRHPLLPNTLAKLETYRPPEDEMHVVDGDLWVRFGSKPSESRLLSALTTKKLGVGTSRIWNTVRRLGDMSSEVE